MCANCYSTRPLPAADVRFFFLTFTIVWWVSIRHNHLAIVSPEYLSKITKSLYSGVFGVKDISGLLSSYH